MPSIPDFWGRMLSWALPLASGALVWLCRYLWRAHTDREAAEAAWRHKIEAMIIELGEREKSDNERITEAQHVSMRQQLLHNAEKYIERNWITPEEKQAWYDMYVAYCHLGANGFMESYWNKLQELPERRL